MEMYIKCFKYRNRQNLFKCSTYL